VFTAAAVTAQDLDNVTVTGTVVDQTASVIADAEVTITALDTHLTRTAKTDAQGRFRFSQLPTGSYLIQASSNGFAKTERQTQSLVAGQRVMVDLLLRPSEITSNVIVESGGTDGVDTTRTVVGSTIERRELEALPLNTRSALDLVFTLPGVTEEPLSTRDLAEDRNASHATTPEEAGKFAVSGGPAYSNNLTIDGLDNNDDRNARERFEPSLEAIDEVQVISNQFAAEYGRASGGRINIRTRGGTSSFHGRVYYFFRDEALNANSYRNNTLGLKRLPLQEHNFGFTFGGPVFFRRSENRTFFFGSHEYTTLLDHALIDTLLPITKSSLFPLPLPTNPENRRLEDVNTPALSTEVAPFVKPISTPFRSHRITTRLDHQFSDLHNAAIVLQLGLLNNLRQFSGGNRLAEAILAQTRNSVALSYSDNFVLSNSIVNQTRVQFSLLTPRLGSERAGPVVLVSINDSLASDDPARRSGTVIAGSSTAGATNRREARWQFQNTLNVVKGEHGVRAGIDFQRITSRFIDLTDAIGTYNFASAGDFLAGVPTRFRQNFLTESTQRNNYLALFVQDEWRLRNNLLLTFGLRYEREKILHDNNNFGPRFSLAYDPFQRGNTVVRFGAGIFYNRALLRTIDDFTLGNQQLYFDTNALQDDTGRLLSADARRAFIAMNLRFPETLRVDSSLVQQFATRNSEFLRRLDPQLRIPESYQANAGIERYLGNRFIIEANLTLNRGLHLWREFNANAPILPLGYQRFSDYLGSRDFANFRNGPAGLRPLYNASTAGELVRFTFAPADPSNPNAVVRVNEFGLPISVFNLNSISSGTPIEVALAALNNLRPDPSRGELEQLVSAGNSFYRALTLELRQRAWHASGISASFRVAYTYSSLTDDGVVNTSDAIVPGKFHLERARSLLDRPHRLVFAGAFDLPPLLAKLRIAPVLRLASGAPFNLSLGGVDRNLDDVGNDRPIFNGDLKVLRWREPGSALPAELLSSFQLPTIGNTGNLPRNAGVAPGLFFFDVNVAREFRLGERVRLNANVEFDNVLNKKVFSFGSEFINFNALAPSATEEQRQAFMNSFLVPTRTLRQRQVRLGLRIEF
jgi:hypothetical protein